MMEQQVLMDKLSEFLLVEQGGLELYQVAIARCTRPEVSRRYQEFAEQTRRHRTVLIKLIQRLGGDPNYVSPLARLAQVKASSLLETAVRVDGLSQEEIEANDLENVLLAETKDHADWELLSQLVQQADDQQLRQALEEAVREVEPQEDEHLAWARSTLAQAALQMVMQGPSLPPQRWQQVISSPEDPISQVHPRPMAEVQGLLETARQPAWQESVVVRAARQG